MGRLSRCRREDWGPRALPKAIAALSRALPGKPSPETFRKAKFDLPEAVAELWSLLFSLLWLIHQKGTGSPREPPDALKDQIHFVKWILRCHGYGRHHFYYLPEVGSQGSCELLLAFSWLLEYFSLPERFLCLSCVHQVDDVWICSCKDLASYRVPLDLSPKGRVDIRYIQWLLGKLRFQWRSLYASQQEQCNLLNKIHLYTRGCYREESIDHLSVLETELLRFSGSTKHVRQHVQGFFESRQIIDTVLDARPVDIPNTVKQDIIFPEILEYCNPQYLTEEMDKIQKNLEVLSQRLQEAVNQHRAASHTKVCSCSQRLQRLPELSTIMMKEIQEAVGCELAALEQDCEVKSWPHGLYRLHFRQAGELSNSETHQMTKVIEILKKEEARLKKTLRSLQKKCHQELAILTQGLEGVIWVLPCLRQ
ncbi:tubulin epsilon and delta complex protein 1 [Antechinus flavipes]|uniref:tubulin epsilon and delta complex protein 1 n=1 Tax=Antechinus flavipes TaxID=38775 RepID=UPI002236393E|nr:tubulin epsilon and delta complex protein 1 [Antechinus flavipes]